MTKEKEGSVLNLQECIAQKEYFTSLKNKLEKRKALTDQDVHTLTTFLDYNISELSSLEKVIRLSRFTHPTLFSKEAIDKYRKGEEVVKEWKEFPEFSEEFLHIRIHIYGSPSELGRDFLTSFIFEHSSYRELKREFIPPNEGPYRNVKVKYRSKENYLKKASSLGINTFGADIHSKRVQVGQYCNLKATLSLWMFNPAKVYEVVRMNHYQKTPIALFFFDKKDRESFLCVEQQYNEFSKHSSFPVSYVALVGIRSNDETITTEQGQILAEKYNIPYYETQATDFERVHQIFYDLIIQYLQNPISPLS